MHLLLDDGRVKATMQARSDGSQSRTYCCEAGHARLEDAARHGSDIEIADELAQWETMPQPVIETTEPVVELNPATGVYEETQKTIEPRLQGGPRPAYMVSKVALADDGQISRDSDAVTVLGVPYRVVHETDTAVIVVQGE